MSHGKQFTLFSHKAGPNGWKVVIALEELGLTYETKYLDFKTKEQKDESYTKYNPNGRIPTLIDHKNNDFAIWESDAILLYLVDKYDPDHTISVSGVNEKYTQLQWLFFQSSGQGPYYGQLGWFSFFHEEKVPSAIERYKKEVLRVFGVLDSVLSKQPWLAGNKPTIADLSFIPWNSLVVYRGLCEGLDLQRDFPAVYAWVSKLEARPAVHKALTEWRAVSP